MHKDNQPNRQAQKKRIATALRRSVTSRIALVGAIALAGSSFLLAGGSTASASTSAKTPVCTDTFDFNAGNGQQAYSWDFAANWSNGVPVKSDFACILANLAQPVTIANGAAQDILGVESTNAAGLHFINGGLVATSMTETSSIVNLIGGIQAELGVNAGVTARLSGTNITGGNGIALSGPGTVVVTAGSKAGGLFGTSNDLMLTNKGTLTGAGLSMAQCGGELVNQGAMNLTTTGDWGPSCDTTVSTPFVNDGRLHISGAATQIGMSSFAAWTNNGTVSIGNTDELNLYSALRFTNAGTISAGRGAFIQLGSSPTLTPSSVFETTVGTSPKIGTTSYAPNGTFADSTSVNLANSTLTIVTAPGFKPKVGQSFQIVHAGTLFTHNEVTGTFGSVNGKCIPGDSPNGYQVNYPNPEVEPIVTLTVNSPAPMC